MIGEGAARGRVLYPDTVAGAKPGGMDLVVGRVGGCDPCARVPDLGARSPSRLREYGSAHSLVYGRRDGGEVGTVRLAD